MSRFCRRADQSRGDHPFRAMALLMGMILVVASLLSAQFNAYYWDRSYYSSSGLSGFDVDDSGNSYLCKLPIERSYYKLDTSGNPEFIKRMYSPLATYYVDLVYQGGAIYLLTENDEYLLQLSADDGSVLWSKVFSCPNTYEMEKTPDGNLLVALLSPDYIVNPTDLVVMEISTSGAILWQKLFPGMCSLDIYGSFGWQRTLHPVGDYIFLTGPNGLVCLNQAGTVLWTKQLAVTLNPSICATEVADEFLISYDSGSYLGLMRIDIDSNDDGNPSGGDVSVLWNKHYSRTGSWTASEWRTHILQRGSNAYLLVGSMLLPIAATTGIVLLDVDGSGNIQSQNFFNDGVADGVVAMDVVLKSNRIMIGAQYYVASGNYYLGPTIIALNSAGDLPGCSYTMAPMLSATDEPATITDASQASQATFYTLSDQTTTIIDANVVGVDSHCDCDLPFPVIDPSPAIGQGLCNPVTVSWVGDPGATNFDVKLDGAAVPACTAIVGSSCSLGSLPSGTHTWSVSTNSACGVVEGPTWSFQAHSAGPGTAIPVAPSTGSTVCSPVIFSWNAAVEAASYDVLVDGLIAATGVMGTVSQPLVLDHGAHTWQVVAKNGCGSNPGPVWSFNVNAPPTPPEFLPAPTYAAGISPRGVAAADFNRDGKPDLVVSNSGSANVSVLSGTGTGGFSAAVNYGVGSGPHGVLAFDFSRDQKIDIATADSADGTVTVLINFGAGVYNPVAGSPFTVGTAPEALAAADFDLDGIPDLAVTNSGSGNVSILLGTGAGSFAAATNFSTGGNNPRGIAAGDFNVDGRPDLVIVNAGSGTAQVLLGDGLGGFSLGASTSVGSSPRGVAVGDFNLDGQLDFVTVNAGSSDLDLALGNGTGSFSSGGVFPAGISPESVIAADVNYDGRLDVAIADSAANAALILLGIPSGFAAPIAFAAGSAPLGIAAADANLDGGVDLMLASSGNDTVAALVSIMGAGDSLCYLTPMTYSTGSFCQMVVTGDFNFDGNIDLAVSCLGDEVIRTYFGTGLGGFTPGAYLTNLAPFSLATGDLNRDGVLDLVFGEWYYRDMPTFLGSPDGTFSLLTYGPTNVSPMPQSIALGDLNRDGILDAVQTCEDINYIHRWLGNGDGSFEDYGLIYPTNLWPIGLDIADFNRDGKLDVVNANYDADNVTLKIGDGNGGFSSTTDYAAGTNPSGVVFADFNGDGRLDLAISNFTSNDVTVKLANTTANGFSSSIAYPTGTTPSFIRAADMNGDGRMDLVTTNFNVDQVNILLGNGAGAFAAPVGYSMGTSPRSLALVDVNHDGKTDMLTINRDASTLSVRTAAPGAVSFAVAAPATVAAGTPFLLTVTALNACGGVATGYTGTAHFTSSDPLAVLPPDTTFSVADNGVKTLPVTLQSTGSRTITATSNLCGSITGTATTIVREFTRLQILLPGETAAPGTPTGKTGIPSNQTANTPFIVTVNAVDPDWYPIATVTDTVTLTATDPSATLPPGSALIGGTRTFSVTLNTAGTWTVTAADSTNGAITPDTSPGVTVMAGAFAKLQLLVPGETAAPGTTTGKTGAPAIQTAGVPFNVTVNAVDARWNVVAATDTVGITLTDPNATPPIDAPLVAGTGTFSVTMVTAGTRTVTATDLTDGSKTPSTSPSITVQAGAFTGLQILVPGETAAPGTPTGKTGTPTARTAAVVFSVIVNAVDAHWNRVTTVTDTVHLASTDAAAGLPADAGLAAGTRTFSNSVSLRTIGTWTLTASDATDGGKAPDTSPSISVSAGPFAKLQILVPGETAAPGTASGKTGTPAGQTAGVPFTVTVNAVDANWYLIDTVTDTAAITSSDANAVLPPNAALSAGTQTFSVTLKSSGGRTVTATDITDGAKTANTSPSITVAANAFAKIQILVPGETAAPGSPTGKTGTPTDQQAGAAFTVIVNAVDEYWNRVTTVTDTVGLSSTDANAILPAAQALAAGTRTFTNGVALRTVGAWTLTATDASDGSKPPNTSPSINVLLGPFSKLQILVPGETAAPGTTSGKTGTPLPQTAGVPFSVTVNAVDSNWYLINTVTDTVAITSSDANAVLPANNALVAGTQTFSVTLKSGGGRTVTASDVTDALKTANTSPSISVVPNAFAKLQILVPGETAAPGSPSGKTGTPADRTAAVLFSVIVNAVDEYWNRVTTVTDTVGLSSTDPAAVLPASHVLASGTYTFTNTVALRTAGAQTLTATDVSDGSKTPNTSPAINVVLGPFSKLQILVPGETAAPGMAGGKTGTPLPQTAGIPFAVTVNAVDSNWYLINTVTDTVAITSSDANATLPANAALAAGTQIFSVTLKTGGSRTVTASDITDAGKAANTSPGINVVPNTFTRLQVLVPGETAAPGSPTGKSGTPAVQRAGTAVNPVVVNAVDDWWNRVTTVTDTVHFASSDPAALLPTDAALAAGTRTYTTATLITVGTWTLTASDATDGGKTPGTSAPIVAAVGPFVKLQVLAPGETAAPGTPAGKTGAPLSQTAGVPFSVTVNAVDSNWYPIGGVSDTVGITSSDPHAVLPANAALVNGTQTYSVTLKAGGSRTVTATDITDGAKAPNTSSAIPVAAAAFVKMQILVPGETADPGSVTGKTGAPTNVNASAPFSVTVNAVDEFWNIVTAVTDTVHLASTDGTATLPGDSALVAGTGVRSVTFNTTPGPFTITLSDVTDGAKTPDTSAPITVVAGAFTRLQILVPGETAAPGSPTGKTGTPLSQTAGIPFNVTVNAVNANWYPIGSVTDTVRLTSTDVNAVLPADTPLIGGTGTFSVTLRTPGTRTITATDISDGSKTANTSPLITVAIGPFAKLQILVPGETAAPSTLTGKTGTPTAISAGALFTVTVRAVDTAWNLVNTVTHTVHLSTTDPAAILPSDLALAAGTRTYSGGNSLEFRTPGTWTITASDVTDGTKLPNTSPDISVVIGPFTKLQVLVPGETAAPGTTSGKTGAPIAQTAGVPFSVTVNAVDANFYLMNTVTDTVAITSSDANAILPSNAALSAGTGTFSVTLRTAGSRTVTASDVSDGSKTSNTSAAITVAVNAFSKMQILVPGETAAPGSLTGKTGTPTALNAGAAFSVTVNAVDDYWNKVTTAPSNTIHLTSTDPAAILPTDANLASGTRTFANLELLSIGTWTITATNVTDGTKSSDTSPGISVVIGPFAKLLFLAPGETAAPNTANGKTGTPLAQTAGVPFDVVVNAVDANWFLINTVTDTIAITSSDANAILPANAPLAAGTHTFSVTLKTGGARTVTATDASDGTKTSDNASITVVPNLFTRTQILVPGETAAPGSPTGKTGTPTTRLAGAAFSVIVNACDDYWNKVTTVTDTIHLSSSDPAAFLPGDTALASGTKTFATPELRTVGSWTMTVEDVSDVSKLSNTSPPIPVTLGAVTKLQILVPGETAAPGTTSGKTGTPAPQTAGVPFNVVVNAVDANWYVITSVTDTVAITSSDANAVLPPNAALAFGTGTFSVTLKSGGGRTVTASDVTDPAKTPNTSPSISVVANEFIGLQILVPGETAAPGTITGKTGAPTDRNAGAAFTVIVNAVDEFWNKVTTVTDTVTFTSTDPAATLPIATPLVAGTKTFTNGAALRTLGSATITVGDFTDDTKTPDTSPSIPVVLGPFAKLQILVPGETAAPGTPTGKTGTPLPQTAGVPFTVTVNAVTDYWYFIDTATDLVGITSSDAYATLPSDAALIAGTQTFSVTLRTGGSRTVTATDLTDGAKSPNTSSGVPVGSAAFAKFQILVPGETAAPGSPTGKTGTPTQRTAGSAFTVIVNAVDEFWNKVATVTDTVHFTSTDAAAILPADTALVAGTKSFTTVALRTVGSWTLTAADATDPGKAPDTSPAIAVVLGAFTKLQILVPGETAAPGTSSGKTGTPSPQTAGVPFTVTVNAVNANWYLINTVTDTTSITSSDANAILPPDAALVNGTQTFQVTLNTGGNRTLTTRDVTDAAKTSNTSPNIAVTAGAFVKLQILAPGETAAPGTVNGKTGTPSARTAGTAFNVTVNAVDAAWNKVSSVTDTVHLVSSDPTATLPANTALAAGTKSLSVNLRTAGTATLTAQDVTDGGKSESTTPPLTVNPGSFAKLQILVPGETASPGTPTGKTGAPSGRIAGAQFTIEVNAVDANWNRVTTVGDTVGITSTDAGAALPPDAALVGGTQTFNVTLNTYGNQRLTASDITTPARTPNTSPDIFVGSAEKLQILLPGETAAPGGPPGKTGTPTLLAAGIPFNVVVNAVDANWNLLPTVTDTVALTSTDGSAILPPETPLVGGTVTLSMTFGDGGSFTVTSSDVTYWFKAPDTSPPVTVIGEAGRPSVAPLVWTGITKDTLTWGAAINATSYKLYEGTLVNLPNLLTGAVDSCLRWSGAATTTGPVMTQIPAEGELYWYLVRGVNSGVDGTVGNATAGLRILNSSGACP